MTETEVAEGGIGNGTSNAERNGVYVRTGAVCDEARNDFDFERSLGSLGVDTVDDDASLDLLYAAVEIVDVVLFEPRFDIL